MQNSAKKMKTKSEIQLFNRENILAIFDEKIEIRERCKVACCELLIGLSFSRFLPFRGCFGQALFPQFSIMDSKNGAKECIV